jgi:DNA excision repair protein ERCC-4
VPRLLTRAQWRLPALFAADPDESLLVLRLIAEHHRQPSDPLLARHDCEPKRLSSRRLHVLQGLPGVGPALARRLLSRFVTVEKVMMAGEEELATVPGIGAQKAEAIRKVLRYEGTTAAHRRSRTDGARPGNRWTGS